MQSWLRSLWTGIVNRFNAVKSFVLRVWNGIKSGIVNAATAIWSAITAKFSAIGSAIGNAFSGAVSTVQGAWDSIVGVVRGGANSVIGFINRLITGWNNLSFKLPSFDIPRIDLNGPPGGQFGGDSFGGQTFSTPNMPTIPALARGGIVTSPTLALVGEAGPELVIPLQHNPMLTELRLQNKLLVAIEKKLDTLSLSVDGRELAKAINPHTNTMVRDRFRR